MCSLRGYLSEMSKQHEEEDRKATRIDISRKEDGFYYCPVCGEKIDENSIDDKINFCMHCGQAINLL